MKQLLTLGLGALLLLTGCNNDDDDNSVPSVPSLNVPLTPVATSTVLWTGVAVTRENRVFANFPRMDTDTIPYSVAEVSGAQATPFPDATWNTWARGVPPQNRFVCVQSVYVDANNFLWVLDPASPQMRGVVPGGAKLLKFDVASRQLVQRVDFDETVVYPTSYLNDVRIDTQNNVAYITDSNQGAIIVVNLATGRSRRLLGNHPSTKSENLILTVEGRVWRNRSGELPSIDSDGIALSPNRDYLYYHALTGRGLYRIATQYLRDEALPASQLSQRVEFLGNTNPPDGMIFDPAGNLYLTDVENNAVTRITAAGQLQLVAQDAQLKWPDSFAVGPDNALYVTTSQLHIPRAQRTEPFRIFKLAVPQ
ncbi:major royal jelly family protein [Hymenobacter weizhouensis]|uniref:major royal jelly family protein n=1 Tax=Hymenobacter sp. YIM 151500-1 TaxID=2987689 RepID=UPI0022261E3B|nr:major royal jelly family protein [Hymenobacter sp. YIM 151500-1]UYZ62627.1 major royal jelly family protein [Hymenobacter sp. YIM 151500-1]